VKIQKAFNFNNRRLFNLAITIGTGAICTGTIFTISLCASLTTAITGFDIFHRILFYMVPFDKTQNFKKRRKF